MGEIIQMHENLKLNWKLIPNLESLKDWIREFSTNPIQTCDSTGLRIKDGAHRTLWQISGPWGSIHVKMNPINNLRAFLRRMVRPSKAEMEATNSFNLRRLGIDTIEVIGMAEETRIGGSGWLISKTIPGAKPLDGLLETADFRCQRILTSKIGDFVAKLHQIGAFHSDFHPGNIVLSNSGQFHVLDIHDMNWKSASIFLRIQNLVIFNRWFQMRSKPWDRLRFLKAYWNSALELGFKNCGDLHEIAKNIENQTRSSNSILWRNRDYKCFGNNKLFSLMKYSGTSIYFLKDYKECVQWLQEFDSEKLVQGNIIKQSKSSLVAKVGIGQGKNNRQYIVKQIPHMRILLDWFRSFNWLPGKKSWLLGHSMIARGINTPIPFCYLSNVNLSGCNEIVLTEFIDKSCQLDRWWKANSQNYFRSKSLIQSLGKLIFLMHCQGIRHRDLKAANILVDQNDKLFIVDLVGASIMNHVPDTIRIKDLARLGRSAIVLGVALTACLRFIKAYGGFFNGPEWKDKWHDISSIVKRDAQRQRLRFRPPG